MGLKAARLGKELQSYRPKEIAAPKKDRARAAVFPSLAALAIGVFAVFAIVSGIWLVRERSNVRPKNPPDNTSSSQERIPGSYPPPANASGNEIASVATDVSLFGVNGMSQEESQAKATELYVQSCDLGYLVGCAELGKRYWYGLGVAQDRVRAVQLYHRACDGGVYFGCDLLKDTINAK